MKILSLQYFIYTALYAVKLNFIKLRGRFILSKSAWIAWDILAKHGSVTLYFY